MKKLADVDVIFDSPWLADAWVQDKVTRQASWSQIRTLACQLESVIGGMGLQTFKLPTSVCVRPVEVNERRILLPTGHLVLHNVDTDAVTQVMAPEHLSFEFPVLTQVTDRGPIVSSALHFLLGKGYATIP